MSSQYLPIHGIILLGGKGTRLQNIAKTTNKHLLVVGEKRVVEHDIDFLIRSGIQDITLVVNSKDERLYLEVLEKNYWDASINVVMQLQPLGTAHAVGLCASHVRHPNVATLWGDNLFEYTLRDSCGDFLNQEGLCKVHIATVSNPQDFGVIELREEKIINIEDKPQQPKVNTVCTGFTLFKDSVFNEIDHVAPNNKQERDMMDVVRRYLHVSALIHAHISGYWFDVGTSPEAYYRACVFAQTLGLNKQVFKEKG